VGSRDELAAWLERGMSTRAMTQHFITNVEIELDGDRATVRAMFYNPMHLPGMTRMSFCGGYYHHDVVRTPTVEERAPRRGDVWFVNHPSNPES